MPWLLGEFQISLSRDACLHRSSFDGFALNIGDASQSFVSDTLSYMFSHAESVGFKLYVSMDVYASGDACYKGSKASCNGEIGRAHV